MHIRSGWWVVVILLAVGVGLALAYSGAFAFFGLAAAAWYMRRNWIEVQDPDRAILMSFGRYKGALDSGWHMPIPGVQDCCVISGRVIEFELPRITTYTKEETAISVDVFAAFQLGETDECLRRAALNLPDVRDMERTKEMFRKIILSKTRTEIEQHTFLELLGSKQDVEDAMMGLLKGELEKYGYEVKEVEAYNLEEAVKSEAAKIRVTETARAEGIKASADALKDNWQAAGVAMAGELAKSLAAWSSGRAVKGGERKRAAPENTQQSLAQNVANTVRNVFRNEEDE